MGKKYLFAILFILFVLLFHAAAYAVPATEAGKGIVIPARFFQGGGSPWACDVYAGLGKADPCWVEKIENGKKVLKRADNTFAKNGCRITSLAMLLRYHGISSIPDAEHKPTYNTMCDYPLYRSLCQQFLGLYLKTEPGKLDDWIVDKSFYDGNRDPYVASIVKNYYLTTFGYGYNRIVPNYECQPQGKGTNCYKVWWSDQAKTLLDHDLDQQSPPIMQIKWWDKGGGEHSSHFVLIGGYDMTTQTYRAYDPGQNYDTSEPLPPGLGTHYSTGKESYEPRRIDRFKYDFKTLGNPDLSELSAKVYSPVEIQIVDPQGRITGYDPVTDIKVQDIPYSSYSEESISLLDSDEPEPEPIKELYIDKPIEGNYILKMNGTGDGPYTIVLRGTKEDGTINLSSSITGTATPTMSETYRVKYSPTGEASLSQTNEPPVADAGSNQTGEQSYEIALDGSASQDPDGDPLKYSWSFDSKPDGSTATLSDPSAIAPTFTPDKPGIYVLQLVLNDHFTDSDPVTVTITATPVKSRIAIEPNFSQHLSAGATALLFDLNNIGRGGVSSGVIDLSLKDPDGALISAGSQAFSAAVGQSTTVSVPVTIPSLKFGNYTLTYTQSDETRTGNPMTVNVPNSAIVAFSFDKPSYRVRDTANLTLNVMNTGKFNIDNVSVAVLVPDAGYAGTQTISIGQETLLGSYVIQIPDTITAGQHNVNATLALPSGSSATQNSIITVQESELVIRYSGPTDVAAGDTINLTIENTGGVDTSYATQKLALKDSRGIEATIGTLEGSILSGELKTMAVKIPPQAARGYVVLSVILNDIKLGKQTIFYKSLYVNGIEASLDSKTENDVYLDTEAVKAISTITSGSINIENGTLNLKIVKYRTASGSGFSQFLPKTTNGSLNYPNRIAISPDGFIYVADSSNYRIQKFDCNGNFVTKWGNYGSGDGQFNWGQGSYAAGSIAVSYDGSVYVADSYNNRIQKFDGNGNFIGKWGISGGGNGQIKQPYDITIGSDGSVYVADGTDSSSYRVQKFDSNGNFVFKVMGNGNFGDVTDMTVAPDGSLYIADNYFTYSGWRSRIQKFNNSGNYISTWKNYSDSWSLRTAVNNSYIYVANGVEIQKFGTNGNFISKWGSFGANNGQFDFRIDLVLGSDGFVYVADSGNARIQKFDGNGNFNSKWGNEISFKNPVGVAISDSIYVADSYSSSIKKFDHNGEFIQKWGSYGTGNGQFNSPSGIAVSHDGFVYVIDSSSHRVQQFDSNGNFIGKWGGWGSGDGQFSSPSGISVSPDGSIYVADTKNHRIQKFDANGIFIAKWGSLGDSDGQFSSPSGLAVAPDGSVYVVDTYNYRIQKFDGTGNFISKWSRIDGLYYQPSALAIGLDGAVFVADTYNNHIYKVDSAGNFIAKWGGSGVAEGKFNRPIGIALANNDDIYVADSSNYRIQKMTQLKAEPDVLFETTLSITNPANTVVSHTDNIGVLNTTGQLYLVATLKNSLDQTIAASEYPFYIRNNDTAILFTTDKKFYKAGEPVTVSGNVENMHATDANNLLLVVASQKVVEGASSQTVYTKSISIPANSASPFTFATTAGETGIFALTGTVGQSGTYLAVATAQYEVAAPKVTATVTGPDVAGNDPFTFNVEMKNEGKVDAAVSLLPSDDVQPQTVTIPAGQTRLVQYDGQIAGTKVFTFTFTGDLNQTISKTVAYGLAAQIRVGSVDTGPELPALPGQNDPSPIDPALPIGPPLIVPGTIVTDQSAQSYPEGRVTIPVTLTNNGQLGETLTVAYTLQPSGATESRSYYLPASASLTDTLTYELAAGSYQLSAVASQPNASAQTVFAVVKENEVTMTTAPGSQGADGLIPVAVTVANNGYNTINGSVALSVMNNEAKAVWRGEAPVSGLQPQASATVTIQVDPAGLPFGAYPISTVLYSTSGQLLAEKQTVIKTDGPVFEITTMPNHPVFTAGRDATLSFTVKNTGVRAGEMTLAVNALEVLRANCRETLQPGEEKTCQFTFVVPEETYEQEYPVDYLQTAPLAQGTKGSAVMQVAQPKVEIAATLDRNDYRNGDTAELSLTITKQSDTEDGTYVAIIRYGAYHDMQSFALTAQPATLSFRVPLAEITGENLFYGIHFESGREIKRQSLAFNQALPDLAVKFNNQTPDGATFTPEITKDNTVVLATTATNYGQTASLATTLDLYDGEELIESRPVSALNPGESKSISFAWNVIGKGGSRLLRAVVDPEDRVIEFSEMNNTGTLNMDAPTLAILIDTDKDAYKIRQKVYITSTMTNFMATALAELSIATTVEDLSGHVVYEQSTAIGSIPPSVNAMAVDIWDTAGLPADGAYVITQTVRSGSSDLAQGSKQITLEKAPDFTLTVAASSGKVRQGEALSSAVTLDPLHGWNSAVTLSVERLPQGTTVTFKPDTLLLPGESRVVLTTTGATEAGTYNLFVSAQGLDEGEIVNHKVPLTLDVAAFALETTAATQTVEQLNVATFLINSSSRNDYEGDVTLSVAGLPYGTRATLDTEHTAVPGSARLTVSTSKYAKPGTYSLTLTGEDGLVSHTLELGLIIQKSSALTTGIVTAPGPGPKNEDRIRSYNANLQLSGEFTAFGSRYGASTITADIDGDGYDEIIVAQGAGPGNTATLRAFARDGSMLTEYTVIGGKYGLTLAAGDMNGDWVDEVIVGTGPDPNAPGSLKVLSYNGRRFVEQVAQVIYPDMNFGLNIAVGDTDGDGRAEIMTAPGPGPNNPAQISIWDYSVQGLARQKTFSAFTGGYGVNLATGDVDGDGKVEILTGTGPDPKNSSQVRVYRGDGTMINEFPPYATSYSYGVTVTAGDLDENGRDEIITGPGPGPQNEPLVKVFNAEGLELRSVMAYPAATGYGVKVSAGKIGR